MTLQSILERERELDPSFVIYYVKMRGWALFNISAILFSSLGWDDNILLLGSVVKIKCGRNTVGTNK